MTLKLIIASNNEDKIKEIRHLLRNIKVDILALKDIPGEFEVIEDRDTIAGNAMKKAFEIAHTTGVLTIADDTGIFIDALDGQPGVFAARFAGQGCSYADNRRKVLKLLSGQNNRIAQFKTAVAIADPKGILSVVEGSVNGFITDIERGENGFGYDAIFQIDGYRKTYAELDEDDKNKCSHRSRAFESMIPILQELI